MSDTTAPRRPFPIRLFVWSLALVFAGSGGLYLTWELVIQPRKEMERRLKEKDDKIAVQVAQIGELEKEKAKLQTYLKLLKHSERRAQIEVLRQDKDGEGRVVNTLRFREIQPDGTPIGAARDLQLVGDEIYLDTLVIKFEDHFIEEGDPLKGKALLLFRRIFSNKVAPDDGYRLDKEYQAPEIFAVKSAPTEFEAELWKKFWDVANNETLQKKFGVKAAHGQAAYSRLQPNKVYHLILRSTGETTIPAPTELEKPADETK
jgi:hypothetical protein